MMTQFGSRSQAYVKEYNAYGSLFKEKSIIINNVLDG